MKSGSRQYIHVVFLGGTKRRVKKSHSPTVNEGKKSVGNATRYLKKEDRLLPRTRWRVSDPAALPRLNLSAKVPRRCLRRLRRGLERSPRKFSSSSSRARVAVVETQTMISSSRRVVLSFSENTTQSRPYIQIQRGLLEFFSPESSDDEKTSSSSTMTSSFTPARSIDATRRKRPGLEISKRERAVRWVVGGSFLCRFFFLFFFFGRSKIDPFFSSSSSVQFFYIFTLHNCVPINECLTTILTTLLHSTEEENTLFNASTHIAGSRLLETRFCLSNADRDRLRRGDVDFDDGAAMILRF